MKKKKISISKGGVAKSSN